MRQKYGVNVGVFEDEDMSPLVFGHDDDVNGWTGGDISLTGDVYLTVLLKEPGLLVIRHYNEGKWPMVLVSPVNTDFGIRIFGETSGAKIRVETSVEPESVRMLSI